MATKIPKKVEVTIEMTEHVFERINDLRGGVTISDYIAELINEHFKKQKPIPPEVDDKAEVN
jgi:hypothetical protein